MRGLKDSRLDCAVRGERGMFNFGYGDGDGAKGCVWGSVISWMWSSR